jgi:hypothetical protein
MPNPAKTRSIDKGLIKFEFAWKLRWVGADRGFLFVCQLGDEIVNRRMGWMRRIGVRELSQSQGPGTDVGFWHLFW